MHEHAPAVIRVVTMTVSDTRTPKDDRSGPALVEALQHAGHTVVHHSIVHDELEEIRAAIVAVERAGDADAIVLTGGTGIGLRDHTFEALAPLYSLKIDGFGEAFRRLSFDAIGPRALLSRASAGAVGKVLVFSLPGSVHAAKLGIEALVLPLLQHAVEERAGRSRH